MKTQVSVHRRLLFLLLISVLVANAAEKRPMIPEDLFRLESVGGVAVSPDGESVAFVVQRAKASAIRFDLSPLRAKARADVWIASANGGQAQNVTNGAADDSGFWSPKWSPDGQRLVMFSTRGRNVRLWVWTKSSGSLQMLSERGVYMSMANDPIWVSDHELMYSVLPEGETHSDIEEDTLTPQTAEREWARKWEGREATASVLESGLPISLDSRPQGKLLLQDVLSGESHVVSTAANFAGLSLSPNHRSMAFLKQVGLWQPGRERRVIPLLKEQYVVMVANLGEPWASHALTGVWQAFIGSLLWSADGTQLAVIGYESSTSSQVQAFRCKVARGTCKPVADALLDLALPGNNAFSSMSYVSKPPYLWYGNDVLLIRARRLSSAANGSQESLKWWATEEEGHFHPLFSDWEEIPSQLLPVSQLRGLIGISKGKVWRISNEGIPSQNLAPSLDGEITSIEWLPSAYLKNSTKLLLSAYHSNRDDLYLLDLKSGQLASIPKPSEEARLVASDGEGRTILFTAADHTGSYLWLKREGREGFTTLLQTNQFLHEVVEGDLKKIEYRGLDGKELNGWAILPFGYQEGKRYPVVTWVYQGRVYSGAAPVTAIGIRVNDDSPYNLQLLAAHGYVVLLPSMPWVTYDGISDPYMELTKGVLPALDKLIDIGIADPDRLGVMGHSFGGSNTYGLITETNRFKAAVASAGASDLLSEPGTFNASLRFQPYVHEDTFRMWNESRAMGTPQWKDVGRYLRNSPVIYVERVETPLMIIHGDLDFVPIQQGEEFFSDLYEQGKRAEFVRYWGEGHVIDSPANVRDMWRRIYAWFDEFLKRDAAQLDPSSPSIGNAH
jgi:dipeptidyl aminopeptidase/acylaminoacyl peptidase